MHASFHLPSDPLSYIQFNSHQMFWDCFKTLWHNQTQKYLTDSQNKTLWQFNRFYTIHHQTLTLHHPTVWHTCTHEAGDIFHHQVLTLHRVNGGQSWVPLLYQTINMVHHQSQDPEEIHITSNNCYSYHQ